MKDETGRNWKQGNEQFVLCRETMLRKSESLGRRWMAEHKGQSFHLGYKPIVKEKLQT